MSQLSVLCGELDSIRQAIRDVCAQLASHDTRFAYIGKTFASIELNTRSIHTGFRDVHDEVVRQRTLLQRVAQYLTFWT
jgi:hypothetical protein